MNDTGYLVVGHILGVALIVGPLAGAGYFIAAQVGFSWGPALRNSVIAGLVYAIVLLFFVVAPRAISLWVPILWVLAATALTFFFWFLFAWMQDRRERHRFK